VPMDIIGIPVQNLRLRKFEDAGTIKLSKLNL
jgi:hypothetical protein